MLEAGGELLEAAEVFDVYEGEQVGEGNRSLALRLEFRAPDRTLTDDEVAEQRGAIESALSARWEARSVPRVAVIGAAGYGGALGAGIVQRHPGLELTAVTARTDAGKRHDELYPIHRIGLTMDEFDPDGWPRRPTPRWWPTRTRPRRARCARCASGG